MPLRFLLLGRSAPEPLASRFVERIVCLDVMHYYMTSKKDSNVQTCIDLSSRTLGL